MSWLKALDRGIATVLAAGSWLALPVSLLLFAQWPLRDLVRAHATQANDLAQWIFALYVSLAVTFATRTQAHLAADAFARRYSPSSRAAIARIAAALCIVPWSLFIIVAGGSMIWRSIASLEAFPETYSQGYFIVKASAGVLALLALLQALVDALTPGRRG